MSSGKLFLGLDCSTQTLKATIIDESLKELESFQCSVNYDTDLPHFNTRGGVHHGKDGITVTTPTLVWISALDLLFEKLKALKVPFSNIVSISGSGQQHGSVYWKKGAKELLRSLDSTQKLSDQFLNMFSVTSSPIWMDSSTTKYCKELEERIGGADTLAQLTGSVAYERFTINQIRKISHTQQEFYSQTERISLVSSFMASVLIGDYAPIDYGDASGMNCFDIHKKTWIKEILEFCGSDLETKLGEASPAHSICGSISKYFVGRYGFHNNCQIINWSGDNPCSVAGLRMKVGDVGISLGTSDTMFGPLSDPNPSSEGHVFCDPVHTECYMALLCYKNGSLTREHIRDLYTAKDWTKFNDLLQKTPPGNNGNIGFYFKEMEITPKADIGIHRFDPSGNLVKEFSSAEIDIRAVIEGQFLSMLVHSMNIGLKTSQILATGGASKNKSIIQIMADIFGVPVFTHSQPNSACLGAAYRALHGWKSKDKFVSFDEVVKNAVPFTKEAEPNVEAHKVYLQAVERYRKLESVIVKN